MPVELPIEFPNIRHLRAFREVAYHRGISAAAQAVFLSQPAITQAVSKLETQLGVVLFDRLSNGMEVTEAGAMYLSRVDRMLEQLALGVDEATQQQSNRSAKGFTRFDRMITAAQLRALVALAKARNFSIAARLTGISQPSIHRAARDLERLAGVELIRTTSQGIELTVAAEKLARRARLAARELEQGKFELAALSGRDSTRITIGSMPLARTRILPQAMHKTLKLRPDIQLLTIEGPYTELLRGLRYGESDLLIGALRDPQPADDVVQEALFDDPLAVVVRAGHPLSGRAGMTLDQTLDYPWIAPPKPTPAGQYLSEMLHIPELKNTPVRVVSSSLILVRGMLLEGDYVTLISRHQVQHEVQAGILETLPIELPDNLRPIGLTFRKDWQPTPTQLLFLKTLREVGKKV